MNSKWILIYYHEWKNVSDEWWLGKKIWMTLQVEMNAWIGQTQWMNE